MLADDRHGEVGAVLAAEFLGQRVTIVTGLVGQPLHLAQQIFPFVARQALVLEIGTRPFAAMVEEALVVVLRLQRFDLALDELVELDQVGGDIGRNAEIHLRSPVMNNRLSEARERGKKSRV
jgi:hypothetical protein